jgi:Ca-activated chloride channel family protein
MTWQVRTGLTAGLLLVSELFVIAQEPTFRSSTELVNVTVSVVGADSKPVEGLTIDEFEVFEDGIRQELKFFAAGDMPLDVVLLIDTSSSMQQSMAFVQNAAVRFIRALRSDDRATVMGISNGVRILQGLSSDKVALGRAIKSTTPAGRTPLYTAIYTALRELEKIRRTYVTPRRQAIVVLSDGDDTASGFGFEELMDSVRRQAVPIYVIAPRPSQTLKTHREAMFGELTYEQDFELRKLAFETGARAFFPVKFHELTGVYGDIANELAHQYCLGYQSSNPDLDGSFRRIALRVTGRGVQWRARAGYLAERETVAAGANLR